MVIIAVIIICTLVLSGILLADSPGKPKPFLDENGKPLEGSISEKVHVDINGAELGMFIKGKDKTKPVLLFVHGGPAMPEYFLAERYPTGLENYFTVCYWEQRGAGLSYNSDIPPETMTIEQFVQDTIAVTNYLRKRFEQDKIYLMGHSWGSFIGIRAVERAPVLFNAYIGTGQISNQLESEKLAYRYMLEEYKKKGNKRMVKKLERYPIEQMDYLPKGYCSMRDEAMHKLGIGTMHNMKSIVSGVFIPSWLDRDYTITEKLNIWRGKWSRYSTNLFNQLIKTDLTKKIEKIEVPVYFLEGKYDYTCSYSLAKDYFKKLQAPLKGFYTFDKSAHSPIFEEPDKLQKIIREDVVTGGNSLSDKI